MTKLTTRRRLLVAVAAAVVAVGAGLGAWATLFRSDEKELKASETCNEGVFSANVEPLERLLSPDSSFTSDWSREATESSLLLTCVNSTNHASVKMTAELKDGSLSDWRAQLRGADTADGARFEVGTEAYVWEKRAAVYVDCKPHSAGSSHTTGLKDPYLSILVSASGSVEKGSDTRRKDLAHLASRMFFEAQLQTGCQENFVAPSGPPRLTS